MSDSEQNTEREMIELAKLGDELAVEWLYNQHINKIYRYVAYRVPDHEAHDITADVFIKMLEGVKRFTYTGAPFESWLYRIAQARVADYHRKGSRATEEVTDDLTDNSLQPEEFLQTKQEFKQVREALTQLTDDEQTLLLLRFVEQKSHEEVAEILGKSHAAVRTMQHRALHKLATLLKADGKERHYLRSVKAPKREDKNGKDTV